MKIRCQMRYKYQLILAKGSSTKMECLIALIQWSKEHILLLLSTLTLSFFFFKLCKKKTITNLPPSPPRLPLIGNLHQLGSQPHRALQALSNKYGPLMLLHFGNVPTIIVSSADMAQEVMKTHDVIFASRPPMSMPKRLMYDSDIAFSPYGEYWRQVRKISVIHLLSIKKVQSFRPVREEEASILVQKIYASSLPRLPCLVNLSEMVINTTNDIICRIALGKKYYGEEGGRIGDMITEFFALMGAFPVADFIPWLAWVDVLSGLDARVRKNSKKLDVFLERVIEDRLQAMKDNSCDGHEELSNIFDVLLSLDQDKDDTVAVSLSRDSMKAIILDMFAAGTETSFTTIVWAMAELMRNPQIMKKVQQEIRGVVGLKVKIIEEDLDKMNYLKAVVKETLRFHTPVPLLVPRETTEDVKLQNYEIPARTRIIINAWAVSRDLKSWDRAEEFYPERFLDSNIDFRGKDFQFTPFGAGRRGCPGIDFAIIAVELILANLLHHFDWQLPNGMKGGELDMSESSGLTLHMTTSLMLLAQPRMS